MALSVPQAQLYNVTSRDQNGSRAGAATDFLKRPLHNGHVSATTDNTSDSERDLEPATKMRCGAGASAAGCVGAAGGGGGRRKQSKPIRVRADSDVEVPPTTVDQDSKIIAENDSIPADSVSPGSVMVGPTVEADEVPVPLEVFPTKYHQLGNELKQGAELSTYLAVGETEVHRRNGQDSSSPAAIVDSVSSPEKADQRVRKSPEQFSPPQSVRGMDEEAVWKAVQSRLSSAFFPNIADNRSPDWHPQRNVESSPADLSTRSESIVDAMTRVTSASRLPLSDEEMMRPDMIDPERGWDGGIEKSRIFHPDAYCNICDREFCNKYFLKTHRANKHGIYDGPDGVPGGSVGLPGSVTGLPSFPLPPQQLEPPPGTTTAPAERQHEPLKSASSVAPTPTFSLPNMLPVPQLPPNLGMLSFEETNPPPPRNADMEDYCDICQKHFCNKYYLRKHRQDVHGLSPADVAKRPPVNNINSSPSEFGHDESVALRSGFVPPRFPLPTSSSAGSMPALSNFMFLPPFGSPLVMMPPFLQAGGLGFGPVGAGSMPLPRPPMADDKVAGLQFSPDSSTPLPMGSAHGVLSGAGMLSAEACLELYQKELMKFNRYLMNSGGEHDPGSAFNTSPSNDNPLASLPRFPSISSSRSDGLGSSDRSESTDTFAEMLQRIGSRFNSKSENYDSLTSELMRMNGVGFDPASGFPGLCPTSAPSTRLVDRVVCDICNKEVCNKYFLKTHKMKVHGWDPNSSSSATTSTAECSPIKSEPTSSSHREPSTPPQVPMFMDKPIFSLSDKPLGKDTDLQQMGIDPEAYCDICRKEFCSKYFLRTHRQNIHGIRDTSRASSPGGLLLQPPVASSAGLFAANASQLLASLPSSIQPPPQQSCTIPPPLMSVSSSYPLYATADSNSGDGLSSDQRSWKWKEPVNATRVSCTLCNKVLCNKYFLRTHMAKRHGIGTDARLPPPASQLLPGSMVKDEGGRVIQEYQMPAVQSVPSSVHNSAFTTPEMNSSRERFDIMRDIKKEMSPDAGSKSSSSGSGAINLVVSGRSSAPTDVQTVTARTWQVPSEDSSPGAVNADVPSSPSNNNNNNKPAFSAIERDSKKCAMCDTLFTDRETLLQHLENVHQSNVLGAIQNATHSLLSSPSTTTSSPNDAHQSAAASLSPAGSSGIRRRRQFRCAHCRERFRTRVHCELHARAAHPRSSAACIEVTTASDVEDHVSNPRPSTAVPNLLLHTASLQKPVESKSLPQTPIYATPIDSADPSRFCMQPFILQETLSASAADLPPSPHFSTALVYLPTLRPITEPTSVTFTLTPIMQP